MLEVCNSVNIFKCTILIGYYNTTVIFTMRILVWSVIREVVSITHIYPSI